MGRPAKTIQLHKAQGTYRDDRHGKKRLGKVRRLPCPKNVRGRKREIWQRISEVAKDRTTSSDFEAFKLLIEGLYEFEKLNEFLLKRGMTYTHVSTSGAKYPRIRPEVSIRRDCWSRVARLLTKFGMTPSDRTVLGLPDEAHEQEDPIDQMRRKTW